MITMGKYRHLTQCSTPAGHFTVLAIDHRGNLWDRMDQHMPEALTDAAFTAFKQDVLRALLPLSSAVLADPGYGFGPGFTQGTISGQVGVLSPIEVTDYTPHPSRRKTVFMPNWSVAKIKRVGASGVKLLLYYHPKAENAQGQRDIVARIVDECAEQDIPFFLEPIAVSLDADKPLENAELRQVVVESARTFVEMGVDVIKAEFPLNVKQEPDEMVWQAALAELDAACGDVPWALLSAGVDYDTFRRQAQLACEAGASGVMVGRALFAEAVEMQGAEREPFLQETAFERMKELTEICATSARSWRERVAAPEVSSPNWYETYGK